jgi:1-acyl-sn-glycerol-3-phosphate acyltransferase
MQSLSPAYNLRTLNQLDTFTGINLDDLISSVGWPLHSAGARLLRILFQRPARNFAQQMVEFDANIGECGLIEASRILQRLYVKDVRVHGREHLPPGPILILSNHPGMSDTVSLFSAIDRPDLRVIALERPFLNAMPNMARKLYFVPDDPAARMGLVRKVSTHLRDCGAVLTFPAGQIEPDPGISHEALTSLKRWTDSVGVFVRMAPETAIVPILVRGVVWKAAAHHPLLLLKRTREERERLAAALQLLGMVLFGMRPVTVHVQIGSPIFPGDTGARNVNAIHRSVLAAMETLINNPPEEPGESVL